MCVVSMIMDHYGDKWQKWIQPPVYVPVWPGTIPTVPVPQPPIQVPTKEEIDEFYRLLERAREYDKRNNEPDCELESKKQRIRDLAQELGVELNL